MEQIDSLKNQITTIKLQIKDANEQLGSEIQKSKPTLQLDFLTNKELIDSNDPVAAKVTQDKIKKELKELNKLIDELWQ